MPTNNDTGGPPKWFVVVGVLGVLWNLIGVAAFIAELSIDLESLPDAQRIFYEERPMWAVAGYAIAVSSGVLGCLALLLRKSWAAPMLALCVLGIMVQGFYSFAIGDGIEAFGPGGLVLPIAIFVVAVLLTGVAHWAAKQPWYKQDGSPA